MRAGTWTPVLGPGRGWGAAGVGAGHLPPLHRAVPSLPVFRQCHQIVECSEPVGFFLLVGLCEVAEL